MAGVCGVDNDHVGECPLQGDSLWTVIYRNIKYNSSPGTLNFC